MKEINFRKSILKLLKEQGFNDFEEFTEYVKEIQNTRKKGGKAPLKNNKRLNVYKNKKIPELNFDDIKIDYIFDDIDMNFNLEDIDCDFSFLDKGEK